MPITYRTTYRNLLSLGPLLFLLVLPASTPAQSDVVKTVESSGPLGSRPTVAVEAGHTGSNGLRENVVTTKGKGISNSKAHVPDEQRRAFAISLITSLADEARSYHDEALRPKVLARAANALWEVDRDTARQLFRRAWAAAEAGDAQDLTVNAKDDAPPVVMALRRISGRDLRLEVLGLAAQRDRTLGDEFLNNLKEEAKREATNSGNDLNSRNSNDSWAVSDVASKRLLLASKLLNDGQIEQALEFAGPALHQVNQKSISFLSALRQRKPEAADQRYAFLLTCAELDPSSDANTASGLSSYAFTPGLYLTFSPEGGARWTPTEELTAPPNLSPALRNRFFEVAASILLRPLPSADKDFSSAGRIGKYHVIKRLLPLFDQYASDTASALRSQLTALAGDRGTSVTGFETPLEIHGIQPEETVGEALEKLQNRIDRARTSQERDWIYADAAGVVSSQGDARAQDLADKIDDTDRRGRVRRYVDFQLVRFAIRAKAAAEVVRLAKAGQLTHTQRAWAYTQAARLMIDAERPLALGFLEYAVDEARRIDADDPDRPRLLSAVAAQLFTADRVRAWEIMGEVVKSGNSAEKFTGENAEIYFPMATRSGLRTTRIGGEEFGITRILRSLSRDDLYRSLDLAKSFKKDAVRATATLAIASTILEQQ